MVRARLLSCWLLLDSGWTASERPANSHNSSWVFLSFLAVSALPLPCTHTPPHAALSFYLTSSKSTLSSTTYGLCRADNVSLLAMPLTDLLFW